MKGIDRMGVAVFNPGTDKVVDDSKDYNYRNMRDCTQHIQHVLLPQKQSPMSGRRALNPPPQAPTRFLRNS